MAMLKKFVSVELTDGTIHDDMRVLFADRAAAERTFTARKWDPNTHNVKTTGFLAWLAAKRLGYTSATWDEFEPQIVDAVLEVDDGTDDDEDPTQAGE